MKCNEIDKALNGDQAEFKAAAEHIKNCPACRQAYASDLELEYALRDMALDDVSIDIIPELNKELSLKVKRRYYIGIVRGWLWLAVAAAFVVAILLNKETLVTLFNSGYAIITDLLTGHNSINYADITKLENTVESSDYYSYIILAVAVAVVAVFGYLWREFREIVR